MNEPESKEFQQFLQTPNQDSPAWPTSLEKDLVFSKLRLSLTYIGGAALGYLISLALCAQCSVGLSKFAWQTASWIHAMPDPWCAILCGFIFGLSPALATLVSLSRFQHRFLVFRMGWLPLLVPICASLLLLLVGDPHDGIWRLIWISTAVATPYGLERLAARFLRQKRFAELPPVRMQ